MLINFISQGNSYLASYRMRIQRPVELINRYLDGVEATVSKEIVLNADINIFSKHFGDLKENLKELLKCKENGSVTVMDICDDHFDRQLGSYYKDMIKHADFVTCNTTNMKKRIKQVCKKDAFVISDPITFPELTPRFPDERYTPRILWFGHSSNIKPLVSWFPYLGHRVTAISNERIDHPNIDFIKWMPGRTESLIQNFDTVLIPTDKSETYTKTKSPNRAVDALFAGCHVITDNKDIYGNLKNYITIIDDVKEELKLAAENYDEDTRSKIEKGQKFVLDNYGDNSIFKEWCSFLAKTDLIKLDQEEESYGNEKS